MKNKRNTTKMAMHACQHCGGAAYLEDPQEDDWRCLQCARTVPSPFSVATAQATLTAA